MSIQYWYNKKKKKQKFLALKGAYHGDTFGAMSTGARGLFSAPFNIYLFKLKPIPFPQK